MYIKYHSVLCGHSKDCKTINYSHISTLFKWVNYFMVLEAMKV